MPSIKSVRAMTVPLEDRQGIRGNCAELVRRPRSFAHGSRRFTHKVDLIHSRIRAKPERAGQGPLPCTSPGGRGQSTSPLLHAAVFL